LIDEVHGDRSPRSVGNGKRLEFSVTLVAGGLVPEAGNAGFDVVDNVLPDSVPVEISTEDLEGFGEAGVAGEEVIVSSLENLELDVVVGGDDDSSLVKWESIVDGESSVLSYERELLLDPRTRLLSGPDLVHEMVDRKGSDGGETKVMMLEELSCIFRVIGGVAAAPQKKYVVPT
jgi:hypothetical protein